jgi:ribosomal protein S6--L-glutamate ligase
LKIAVVGIRKAWSSETLADAIEARIGYRNVVELSEIAVDFASGAVSAGDVRLDQLDGVVIKKLSPEYGPEMLQRLYLLEYLSASGVAVFSEPERIAGVVDRLACTQKLRQAGVPMPPTMATESIEAAADAIGNYGAAVLKPLYSTKARGMIILRASQEDLMEQLVAYKRKNPMLYIQKMLELPGRDYGVTFLAGNYVGTYARVGDKNSWNTTTRDGGHYECASLSQDLVEIAWKAQEKIGLHYTTVDLAETSEGPVVFEVSAFGGYRGLVDGCGIDIQSQVADHLVSRTSQGI